MYHGGECCDTFFQTSDELKSDLKPCIVPNSGEIRQADYGEEYQVDPTCPRMDSYPRYRDSINEFTANESYPSIGPGIYPSLYTCVVGGPLPPGTSPNREAWCGTLEQGAGSGQPPWILQPPMYACSDPHADYYEGGPTTFSDGHRGGGFGYHASYYGECVELDGLGISQPVCNSDRTLVNTVEFGPRCLLSINHTPKVVAIASPNPVISGETLTLDGSGSLDLDSEDVLSYRWDQQNPPGGTVGFSKILNIEAPAVDQDTTFTYTLTVDDNRGSVGTTAVNTESVSVIVKSINRPPVAVATIDPTDHVEQTKTVFLNGKGSSDPDGDPITYAWQKFSGDLDVTINDADKELAYFDAPAIPRYYQGDGIITFSLTVTDNHDKISFPPAFVSIKVKKCSDEDDAKANEVNQRVTDIINYANDNKLYETEKRMEHWRQGSGFPLPLDVDWLKSTKSIQSALTANHERFQTNPNDEGSMKSIYLFASDLKDGEQITITDTWNKKITIPEQMSKLKTNDLDFALSVGTTQLTSIGKFTIIRTGNIYDITGQVNNSVKDTFDYNPNDTFPLPPHLGFYITAADLNLLQKCKDATPFQQDASWDENLQAQGTLKQIKHSTKIWKWT